MSTIDDRILNIDRVICRHIGSADFSPRGAVSQDVLAQLRNFLEHIMLKFYANGGDIDNTYENICKAIEFVQTRGDLKLLYKFHGIYVWTNTSTQSKLSVLNRVFKLYDADPTDLVFYLREENEGVEDEVGTRYELRRKYWTYALDYINKAHGEGGSFSNVNPSKENWINGFFGISGFSLCCVANYDSARVELYLGKAKKEDNKKAFDAVILHKDAIENSLGVKLIWNRGDDIKSSKISYQINDVSIENETDWLQMAKFHAHWSKKFYDVIVPYLR